MTPAQAKKLVLSLIRPRMVVCDVGGRYFLGVQKGKGIIQVSDGMYFSTIEEAKHFADCLDKEIMDGNLIV